MQGTFSFHQRILHDVELYFFLWVQAHYLVLKGVVFSQNINTVYWHSDF